MDLGLKGKARHRHRRQQGHWPPLCGIFADEGAHVAICARTADEVDATVAGLWAKGVTAHGSALDVTDKAARDLGSPMPPASWAAST